jgi:hypothetical protein
MAPLACLIGADVRPNRSGEAVVFRIAGRDNPAQITPRGASVRPIAACMPASQVVAKRHCMLLLFLCSTTVVLKRCEGEMNAKPLRQYQKPTLIKGPVLSSVTGFKSISGVPSDDSLT